MFTPLKRSRSSISMSTAKIAVRKFVFDAHGTLGFDFDVVAEILCHRFQSCRGHVSVSNACRTRSDGNDPHTASLSSFRTAVFLDFRRLIDKAVKTVPVMMASR